MPEPRDTQEGATAAELKAAGACFYALPEDLKPGYIDPLIRDAVFAINASGWVWTGESCQGHPDATEPRGWEHNIEPMLRLITTAEDYALMLQLLTDACWRPIEEQDEFMAHYPLGLSLYPQFRDGWSIAPYREVLVYVKARQTIERNAGLRLFERFADNVVEHGEEGAFADAESTSMRERRGL